MTFITVFTAALLLTGGSSALAAAGVGLDGTQLLYFETDGEGSGTLTITSGVGSYEFADPGTDLIAATPSCTNPPGDAHRVVCAAAGVTGLGVGFADGDDQVTVDASLPAFLCGGTGSDHLTGGSGDDLVIGGPDSDELSGGPGVDDLIGAYAGDCSPQPAGQGDVVTDTFDGGVGVDFLYGGPGADTMLGGPGDDFAFGFGGADGIGGGGGADALVGLDGADDLSGGEGNDFLSGGADDDRLRGDAGNDELGGIALMEFEGDEFASVDFGDDVMDGGIGDDGLAGGPVVPTGTRVFGYRTVPLPAVMETAAQNGADTLRGGPGRDRVTYEMRLGTLDVTLDGIRNDGAAGERDLVEPDVELLTGGSGPTRLVGNAARNTLDGGRGPDLLVGGDGNDHLDGGGLDEAADILDGERGLDVLDGGPGDDRLAGSGGDDRLNGSGGNDVVNGGSGDDMVHGGAGDDTLRDSAGVNTLGGDAGADTADYRTSQRPVMAILDDLRNDGPDGRDLIVETERLRGGAAGDLLRGNASANVITGGAGDDRIDGGAGVDVLRGGKGRDVVRARDDGRDRVACGPQVDFAPVDALDTLAPGPLERCERADDGATRRPRTGRFALLSPRACELAVSFAKTDWFVPVQDRIRLPFGSRVRPGSCAARLTTAAGTRRARHRLAVATLSAGTIVVRQPRSQRLFTLIALVGGDFRQCDASARHRHVVVRRASLVLRGTFRVRGRYSETRAGRATIMVTDRCDGTLTEVLRGTAEVRDVPRGRRFALRRGGRHLARPSRRT